MSSAEKERLLEDGMNRLRGRMLGMIESWGLKESQEHGAKSTLKYLTYEIQKDLAALIEE